MYSLTIPLNIICYPYHGVHFQFFVGPNGSIIVGSTSSVKKISLAGPHESELISFPGMKQGHIYDVAFDNNNNTVSS